MADFHWHFGRRSGGSDVADNIDAKFFNEDYASLVRESLQNSLDAQANNDEPVVVTFKFGSRNIPANSPFFEVEKYIEGCLRLKPNPEDRVHKAYAPMLQYIKDTKEKGTLSYLEVSDSNTIGMDYVDDDERCASTRFYSFAKSVGNSFKDNNTRGGSYGLGKAVFYKNSSMRTIIVSTRTEKGEVAFEGVASLCTSKVDGQKYEATGYFCENDDEKPTIDEQHIPEEFRRELPGTSIYIMGVTDDQAKQEQCYKDIKRAISQHFWLSILHKKLVVEVGDVRIDDSNIIDIASESFKQEIADNNESPIPYIETVYYAEGEADGYKKIEKDVPKLGQCILYIHKDRKGKDKVLNMRKTEMLIYEQDLLKGYGYYAVFVCLGDKGNTILRMSEDPSHRSWNSSNCEEQDRQAARLAIQYKNTFLKDSIISFFGRQNEKSTTISDLQNYLYMNVSEKELEETRNSIYGIHSGEKTQEESQEKIPDLFPDTLPKENTQQQDMVNIFVVEESTSADEGEGENQLEGGHEGHGEGETNPRVQPIVDTKFVENKEDGEDKGTFLRPIPVQACAIYNKVVDNVLYHCIRLIPGMSCAQLVLDVYATGDEDDAGDEIFIDNVFPGDLEGTNRISGLSAKEGERLEIRVKFEDNMKHPVTVLAYENSQSK